MSKHWLTLCEPRIIRYASRADWVRARSTIDPEVGPTLGASDLGVLFGDAAYATPADIYATKKHGAAKAQTESMRRGRLAEEYILALAGASPWSQTETVRHLVYPWLRATPDGLTAEGLVEAKRCHDPREWASATLHSAADWERGIAPLPYYVQVQIQLACTGAPLCDLVAGVGKWDELVTVRIYPDPEWTREIIGVASAWRDRYLLGDAIPPDHIPEIEDFTPTRIDNKRHRPATDEEAGAIEAIIECRAQAKFIDAAKDRAERVLLQSGEAKIVAPAGKCSIFERGGVESVSIKALRDSAPELYRALVAGGHVNVSATSTQVGIYPTKPKE